MPDIAWIDISEGQVALTGDVRVFQVKPFRIAKYPVTNVQFEAFLNADDGYRNKEWWEDIKQSHKASRPRRQEANAPRELVSWYDAVAFCRWLSSRTKTNIRLPTEWEWQQAATGGDPAREYPWPGGWDTSQCNSDESPLERTTAVGIYPYGATQQGVLDMAGNVWEWCVNTYDELDTTITTGGQRVRRGGAWGNEPGFLRSSTRNWFDAGDRLNGLGFRLAQDLEP